MFSRIGVMWLVLEVVLLVVAVGLIRLFCLAVSLGFLYCLRHYILGEVE